MRGAASRGGLGGAGVETITSCHDIDELFRRGKRASDPLLVVLWTRTPEGRSESGRVLFVAGKKIGGAVRRNRCKRVMRAACRRIGGPWAGFDVALVARRGLSRATAEDVDAAMSRLLVRAGVRA